MKLRRAGVALVVLVLLTGLWVVGGSAWAARRERQCEKEWAATFGRLDDSEKTYPRRETNDSAKRLEEITRGSSFDLTPRTRKTDLPRRDVPPAGAEGSQAIADYVVTEISRGDAVAGAPPPSVARFFEEKRAPLDAIESMLTGSPAPEWSLDVSVAERDSPLPNLLGHMRLQRILTARALAAAQAGRDDLAARSLEAAWRLNASLWTRPETISVLIAIAGARLQVGVLRKASVDDDLWKKRLGALDARRSLLGALVLDSRLNSSRNWWRDAKEASGDSSWLRRFGDLLVSPVTRSSMADYSSLMRGHFSTLRGAPLSDHFADPPAPPAGNLAQIIAAISLPNINSSFVRADRLTVDAELTAKILEAKRLRKENGTRWPAAIPGIESSRFPGASWRYEASPDGGRMSIAFSRELASPYVQNGVKPLPLSFSSN